MNYEEIAENLSKEKIISLLKLEEQFQSIQQKLSESEQMVAWFKQQLFGKKSEKRYADSPELTAIQLYLNQQLKEQAAIQEQIKALEKTEVKTYHRGKAKKLDLENAVSETGLRFDNTVPVKVIEVPNKAIEGLTPEEYEEITTKITHRLAQTNCYKVIRYEMKVFKIEGFIFI